MTTNIVPGTLEPPTNGTKEPMRMLMEMEILHPVHWTVRAFLDPPDLRELVKKVITNPVLILNGIKFLFINMTHLLVVRCLQQLLKWPHQDLLLHRKQVPQLRRRDRELFQQENEVNEAIEQGGYYAR